MLPSSLLQHQVTIRRYAGNTAAGPTFDPPETHPAFVEEGSRYQNASGVLISVTRVYLQPTVPPVPAESQIDVSGRSSRVIESYRRDGGNLPVPSHLELVVE